jgi:hypothetical protein
MPPAPSPAQTFTGPVPGSAIEPELLARGCWALALLTEFYRVGPMTAGKGPLALVASATRVGLTPDIVTAVARAAPWPGAGLAAGPAGYSGGVTGSTMWFRSSAAPD